MIKFLLTDKNKVTLKKTIFDYKSMYPEALYFDGKFQIIIEDKIFFDQQHFPIIEFIVFVCSWVKSKNKSKDMLYEALETEDNPLVSFVYEKENWFIRSPWQLFDCTTTFSREELENAVLELRDDVEKQLAISIPLEVLPPSP